MKPVRPNKIRPTNITTLTIKPIKIRTINSIRPARSLRKPKIAVTTPIKTIFNRKDD